MSCLVILCLIMAYNNILTKKPSFLWIERYCDYYGITGLNVPLDINTDGDDWRDDRVRGLIEVMELAYCRYYHLRSECEPLSRKRRRTVSDSWTVKVSKNSSYSIQLKLLPVRGVWAATLHVQCFLTVLSLKAIFHPWVLLHIRTHCSMVWAIVWASSAEFWLTESQLLFGKGWIACAEV